uniref:EGF-like domain-containing protein n=1 Tax=Caenorhabditis tropicalis TaxID=1561998 RepID=A0A1I7U6V3_9PELO
MKFASCFVALFLFWPHVVNAQKAEANQAKPGLHDIILKTVHDTASYLGFGVKCRNGGHKTEDNTCICPKYFKGKECESKICINGGKLEKVTVPTVHQICKCPHPEFIGGEHCEKVRCASHGDFIPFSSNSTWRCDCKASRFYGGMFCEKFILSSGWIMALACFGVFVIVAFICSSNWFSRNRGRRRYPPPSQSSQRSESRTRRAAAQNQQPRRMPRDAHRSSSSDDLISSERGAHRRTTAFPTGGITQQYVVRLDTIPTFNPSMIGGVEPVIGPDQHVGPPPSYDQAMSSIRAEPPVYTPTDAAAKIDS